MCTNIVETAPIAGWGKGADGWFELRLVSVSFDHPMHAPLEHAVNIDFTNTAKGLSARVAVELTPDAAKELIRVLQAALERGDAQGVTV
jgi:hypothetical protein